MRPAPCIGTASWALPPDLRNDRVGSSGLARYAELFNAVEINSTHYKYHLERTFIRWRNDVPAAFRFAVKMHRNVTHVERLGRPDSALAFLRSIEGLGEKLGVVLIQLPPSLVFSDVVEETLRIVRSKYAGALVVEPRHPSWATGEAEKLLRQERMGRVAADPPLVQGELLPGGDTAVCYYRLHGNPQMYHSVYTGVRLASIARDIRLQTGNGAVRVMFDNTASGQAQANALKLRQKLELLPL